MPGDFAVVKECRHLYIGELPVRVFELSLDRTTSATRFLVPKDVYRTFLGRVRECASPPTAFFWAVPPLEGWKGPADKRCTGPWHEELYLEHSLSEEADGDVVFDGIRGAFSLVCIIGNQHGVNVYGNASMMDFYDVEQLGSKTPVTFCVC